MLTLQQMIQNALNVTTFNPTLLAQWVSETFTGKLQAVQDGINAVLLNFLYRIPYQSLPNLVLRLYGIFTSQFPALLGYQTNIAQINAWLNAYTNQQTQIENQMEDVTRNQTTDTEMNQNSINGNSFNPMQNVDGETTVQIPTATPNQPMTTQNLANLTAGNDNSTTDTTLDETLKRNNLYTHYDFNTINQMKLRADEFLEEVIRSLDFLFVYFQPQPMEGLGWF